MTPSLLERAPGRRQLLLIPLAALIAVIPLIHYGCSCGHDFDFHLLNWMEAARQFGQGNLYPHWAFTPAFNAGEPRFVFYPPLSWVLGALLGLLLTHLPGLTGPAAWNATPIVFTWIALTASGLTLHRLARQFIGANGALLAAILYLANPYMLFTAYERTAYAELLAAAWIPLLFHAILRQRVTSSQIAIPIALLWLTNAPAAVMGSYTLAILAAIRVTSMYRIEAAPGSSQAGPNVSNESEFKAWRLSHRSSLQLAFKGFAGAALGLACAAFYIVPAAFERRYVQIAMATTGGMRIDQNFLFEHTGTSSDALLHDQVLRTASLIAVLLLAATVFAIATTFIRRKRIASTTALRPAFPIRAIAMLTVGIAFLLTPLSLPVWKYAPQAVFLQFPWRLLAILAPIFALVTAATINPFVAKHTRNAIATVVIVIAVVFSHAAYHEFHQLCYPEDTAPARLALFLATDGTDPTDEYTPTTADNDALTPDDPPYWLAASPTQAPPTTTHPGTAPTHLTVTAPLAEDLILNLRDYPAWKISRISEDMKIAPVNQRLQRPDGLIAIPIPAGTSTIDIHYSNTLDRTAGDAITLVALGLLLLIRRKVSRTESQG